MQDPRTSAGPTTILAVFVLLLLAGSGVIYFLWQRQQALSAVQEELRRATEAELAALAQKQSAARKKLNEPAPNYWGKHDPRGDELNEWESSQQETTAQIEATIRGLLQAQQQAWNTGNINQFMQAYWRSNKLTFSFGGKVARGWQATLDGYKNRYATRDDMGQLTFDDLEITLLGKDAALVLGSWQLTHQQDTPSGKFSLVLRRIDGQWLIVHDHTSKVQTPSGIKD